MNDVVRSMKIVQVKPCESLDCPGEFHFAKRRFLYNRRVT